MDGRTSADAPPKGYAPGSALLVGQSCPMQRLSAQIHKAAQTDCDILITGETGTGKGWFPNPSTALSRRHNGPFITNINCGALDEALLMDTLARQGAFTEGKRRRAREALLAACKGTLLLDEVGNASPKVQQALLRALSTRQI